jgi:hypothetical protein
MIQLRRHRSDSVFSYYDNHVDDENELMTSKWSLVRQRLPDILALSPTYRPASVRGQLILLVALMSKQAHESPRSGISDYNPLLVPSNVVVNIRGRSRLIYLKRIPSEQMMHVDIDGLSFSMPTRQFILAISRDVAHQTVAKYCPPAMSDMLIDLSKTKVVDDSRQYRRALLKMRVGQTLFFSLFIFISGMFLALFLSTTKTVFKLSAFNYSSPSISIASFSSNADPDEYWNWR